MACRTLSAIALLALAACTHGQDAASSGDAITMSELPIQLASVTAGTFDQAIDHTLGTTVTGTFKQRFWYSTEFATGPSSPVILHICGEYECDASYLQRLADVAKSLHAVAVTLEHRYYGASLPYGDRPSRAQYQYLTISQALDDIASFTAYTKTTFGWNGGWIAAGGSYAGMLAAFVRLKHPEAIAGAWASSAPVNVQQSFWGYDAVTSRALGQPCGDALRLAMSEVPATLADPAAGPAMLKALFSDPGSQQWISSQPAAQQAGIIQGMFSGEAMNYAQTGQNGLQLCSALAQYPNHPVDGMVGYFNPPLVGDDDDDAGAAPAPAMKPDAIGPGGAAVVTSLADPAPPGSAPSQPLPPEEIAMRSWNWQACSEMGFIQVSNPDRANSIMEPTGPEEVLAETEQCQQYTGAPMNITATRENYYTPIANGKASNILFVNGSFDPWSSLSFTDPTIAPPGTTVYVIAQGHHHQELESLTPTSLLGEFEAHKLLHDLAVKWLATP